MRQQLSRGLMDHIFNDMRDFTDVYIDDIVIFSNTYDEHLEHLTKVFSRLAENKLFVKKNKCAFSQPEIEVVGFIVGSGGIRPMPQKLQAIYFWERPQDVKDIRSFLGVCGFYHRFIHSFATLAAPLTNLLHKSAKWNWTEREQSAFEKLKHSLLHYVVLAYPDLNLPYILYTDASNFGTGAMLCQKDSQGDIRLIACTRRKLNQHELNYPVHEKEILALVDALHKWRHHIKGTKTQVFTENTCIRFL